MKKVFALIIVVSMVCSASALAADDANNAMTKLGRGLLNIVDAVTEIPGTIVRESNAEGAAVGLTKGTIVGVVNTVVRAVVGVYEVATFPLPIPADYEPILDDPKFLQGE